MQSLSDSLPGMEYECACEKCSKGLGASALLFGKGMVQNRHEKQGSLEGCSSYLSSQESVLAGHSSVYTQFSF